VGDAILFGIEARAAAGLKSCDIEAILYGNGYAEKRRFLALSNARAQCFGIRQSAFRLYGEIHILARVAIGLLQSLFYK